ncbi:MAG: hypothetical protein Q4C70_14265, partial [Planctomycetia bacterium]|nr:hypothetical protein [Planctomycetia bacterium]
MNSDNNFHLPFTTIEEYMLLDDSTAYPMDSIRLLHFTGMLEESALRSAFHALCERHPLLTLRAECGGKKTRNLTGKGSGTPTG